MVYPPLKWFVPPLNGVPLGPRSLSLVLETETPLAAPFRFHFSESRGWFFRRGSASTSASFGPTNSDAYDLGRRLPRASHHGMTRGRDLERLRARRGLQGAGNPVFEENESGLTQGSSKCLTQAFRRFCPKWFYRGRQQRETSISTSGVDAGRLEPRSGPACRERHPSATSCAA